MTLNEFRRVALNFPATQRMPALFVGHGSPMNAVEDNVYTKGWAALGRSLPRPRAILAVSAHWLTEGTFVHVAEQPRTIHDFWGFPKALYDITYPCPGTPEAAEETKKVLAPNRTADDRDWGIDHGTWVVLSRMFPAADIPVFQLSIDVARDARAQYDLGKALAPLRERGVLIMGSGNIVHNLGRIVWEKDAKPFDWAIEFDARATSLIEGGDYRALVDYEKLGSAAALAIPTPDHYWPLLYVLGATKSDEERSFPVLGIAHGSVSMRAIQIGG